MNWLGEIVQSLVTDNDTVLDLGCGIMQATIDLQCKSIVGVDIFPRYLEEIKHLHSTMHLSVTESCVFLDQSYDVVTCLDVLEHLEKSEALQTVRECKRICRKAAILYTPQVFRANYQSPGGAWGLGDNIYQLHRCILLREELESEGYKVSVPELNNPTESMLAVYERS